MNLTSEQVLDIRKYTNIQYTDRQKLITYLESHEIIEQEVFKLCSKAGKTKSGKSAGEGYDLRLRLHDYCYIPVDRETFIRRIPFYFYIPEDTPYGPRLGNIFPSENSSPRDVDYFYRELEILFYKLEIPLYDIFNYPCKQTITPRERPDDIDPFEDYLRMSYEDMKDDYKPYKMFPQWFKYLSLCKKFNVTDYMPRHFISAYNEMLERNGEQPIIYKPITILDDSGLYKVGTTYCCEGVFPCDDKNVPILKWTNIKVENPAYIHFSGDYSWVGTMTIGLAPDTKIYYLWEDKGDDEDNETEELYVEDEQGVRWVQEYAGPQTMVFDYEALKRARTNAGITQKQLAEAIGVAFRTYQKWEYGDSTPDGLNLIRIMNWLGIDNVQSLVKYIEPTGCINNGGIE